MHKIFTFLSAVLFLITGCTSVKNEDYEEKTPKLDIRHYLNGPLEARGIIYDIAGKADKEFYVKMHGNWNGNIGTLEEHFTFSDGKTDQRTWTIELSDDHNFTATAHDVIGKAKGTQYGNTANMRYTLNAKRDNGDTIELAMDDWLYLVSEKVLINRTKMRKFGITVGELVITFNKL